MNGVKIVIRRKANGIFSFQIENIESTFIRGSQPSEDLCILIPWMRRNIHVVTIIDRLAAECFKRAQLVSSSPSLGPRSFATRSRKGLVFLNSDRILTDFCSALNMISTVPRRLYLSTRHQSSFQSRTGASAALVTTEKFLGKEDLHKIESKHPYLHQIS